MPRVAAAGALMVKVRQDPSCLAGEEMAQPCIPHALGLGRYASRFAHLLREYLPCLIQSLRFLVSHNGRSGPRKQICLKASLRFFRGLHPFPAQVLGGLRLVKRDPVQRGPCSLFITPSPPGWLGGLSPHPDMPGLKSQLPNDRPWDLSKSLSLSEPQFRSL